MKTFLKMLLATILGGLILCFLAFVVLASFISLAEREEEMAANSILKIDINNVIKERSQDNPLAAFDPLSGMPESPLGLNEVLSAINKAADDDNIIGIYLKGGIPITGNATISEIRNALFKFRESGKFVYSYSEIMTQKGFYLTSAADSIFMIPEGFFEWSGLSSSVMYYKEATEKLGVEPVVLRATGNKFKSAVEPFLRQDMSTENEHQLTELLHDVWDDYLNDIAAARNLEASFLNQLADTMVVSNPIQAAEHGLISRTAYEDEILRIFLEKTGEEEFEDIAFITAKQYGDKAGLGEGSYSDPKIAVVIAQGEIQSGDAGEYVIGSKRIAEAIRKARKDDDVKAIVLRVNSPGGSALASEVIWREVMLAQQAKPVIASLGDLAASGGYYISCFADTIVAQPTTITGSIGAFGLFMTGEELMNEKLGLNIETVKTNKYGDLGTFDRQVTPAERKILISQVDQIYQTFVHRVATGRNMSPEMVDSLGGGRVYSGREAKNLGLVDLIGGIDTSLAIAAKMAGIEEGYRVVEYPELEDPLVQLMQTLTGDYETRVIKEKLGPYAQYLDVLEKANRMQGFQTRLEYDLEIE